VHQVGVAGGDECAQPGAPGIAGKDDRTGGMGFEGQAQLFNLPFEGGRGLQGLQNAA